jgi:hypothetical protein
MAAPIAAEYHGPSVDRLRLGGQVTQYRLGFPANQIFSLDDAIHRTGAVVQMFDHLVASGLQFRILIKVTVLIGDPTEDESEWYDFVLHPPPFDIEPAIADGFRRWDQV